MQAFFRGTAGFLEIPRIVEYVLNKLWSAGKAVFASHEDSQNGISIGAVLDMDRKARELAVEFIEYLGKNRGN